MKYRIYGEDEDYHSIEAVVDDCITGDYHGDDDYFEEWLNDLYESVEIAGRRFTAYEILDGCDGYLLNDLRNDYCEEQDENDKQNAIWDLEHAEVGDDVYIQGTRVIVLADDEEEEELEEEDEDDAELTESDLMPSGDYDGDEDRIQVCRQKIEDERLRIQQIKASEEAEENELLNLFQVIQ